MNERKRMFGDGESRRKSRCQCEQLRLDWCLGNFQYEKKNKLERICNLHATYRTLCMCCAFLYSFLHIFFIVLCLNIMFEFIVEKNSRLFFNTLSMTWKHKTFFLLAQLKQIHVKMIILLLVKIGVNKTFCSSGFVRIHIVIERKYAKSSDSLKSGTGTIFFGWFSIVTKIRSANGQNWR